MEHEFKTFFKGNQIADLYNVDYYDYKYGQVRKITLLTSEIHWTAEPIFSTNEDGSSSGISDYKLELLKIKANAEIITGDDLTDFDHRLNLYGFAAKFEVPEFLILLFFVLFRCVSFFYYVVFYRVISFFVVLPKVFIGNKVVISK